METDVRNRPSFAAIFATLGPGDVLTAESGAMASMDSAIKIRTKFNGGFFKGLARKLFGKESLFVNEFRCDDSAENAQVVLTQSTPGDILCVDLKGESLFITAGSYIASGPGVKLTLGWAGFRSWFAREGLFRLKVRGEGQVWLGGYGGCMSKTVDDEYVVDTEHLLAYEPSVKLRVGLSGGIFSSFFSGEGFVSRMQGSGKIYIQTRGMGGLASWTNRHLF